jgi:hypothetical protein
VTDERMGQLIKAIRDQIGGGPYDMPHPTHGEQMSVAGGLFAVASAIDRLTDAVQSLGDR